MAQYAAERAEAAAPAVANPAPLGLSAFALTTFVLSSSNAGFLFPAVGVGGAVVIGLAIFYGGVVQLVAGIQEFRAGNTFGATAFCSYGGFWLAIGATFTPAFGVLTAYKPAALGPALGFFLLGWTIFTALMFLGTLRTNMATIVVFGLLTLTFLLLALGALAGSSGLTVLGGWLGILTALAAWYTALAGIMSSGKGMFNLPVGPRS